MTTEQRPSCPHCEQPAVTGTAVSTRAVVLSAVWQCQQGHTWLLESEPTRVRAAELEVLAAAAAWYESTAETERATLDRLGFSMLALREAEASAS